nr:MAG TPA: lysozyme [Caudoviricetes sp.]
MKTSSIAWPKMFDISRNKLAVYEDNRSVVNRTKLLMLSDPTELYMEPNFGVGLKKYLWQYNNDNQKARIKDDIISQLRLHEPCCIPEDTQFADGLLYTGTSGVQTVKDEQQSLKMTVAIKTTFSTIANINTSDLQARIDYINSSGN